MPNHTDRVLKEAVEKVRGDWCKDFFKGRKRSPGRIFANYQSAQTEAVFQRYGIANVKSNGPYYELLTVPLTSIRGDESLQTQDRRDLDHCMVREQTMLSFQKNEDDQESPALVARHMPDDTYVIGDGRHRFVWEHCLGCTKANAYVVFNCNNDMWDSLRRDFNEQNGAQLSEDERLLLVYAADLKGGQGPVKALCRQHGVTENKYRTFKDHQRLKAKATELGLVRVEAVPHTVLAAAVELKEKIGTSETQKIMDGAISTAAQSHKPKAVPTKEAIAKIVKPLLAGRTSAADVAKAASELKGATEKAAVGGRNRKDYSQRLKEHFEGVKKVTERTTPKGAGLALVERVKWAELCEQTAKWLRAE